MSRYKKIGIGLCVVMTSLLAILISHKTLAAPGVTTNPQELQALVDSLTFQDRANITGTFQGETVTFTDNNPTDGTPNYALANASSFPTLSSCNNFGFAIGGINISSGNLSPDNLANWPTTVKAAVLIGYKPDAVSGCKSFVATDAVIASPENAQTYLQWGPDGNLAPLPGVTGGSLNKSFKLVPGGSGSLFAVNPSAQCGGGDVVIASGPFGQEFQIDNISNDNSGNNLDMNTMDPTDFTKKGECWAHWANFSTNSNFNQMIQLAFSISGNPPPPGSVIPGGSTGSGTTDNSCEAKYTGAAHEFNFLFCGILRGFDSIFNTLRGLLTDQLDICTGKSSTTEQPCKTGAANVLTDQVKQAWSVFKNIASAILVIIMLIMIFAQAIGTDRIDAYTVRKMLPRIVAAVIIMQVSWFLLKWVIDFSNDLGRGIYALMLDPFGGSGSLSLSNQIGAIGSWAPSFTFGIGAIFTGIAIVFSGLTIFGVALLGLAAVASLLVGVLVLLFRQILIIMLMILAPVALIAWILPGTQQYWKMWKDNFIKLLFMFPMIMALLAAGEIFAHVGSGGHGLFGLIIVFVGVLGPYFMLPKTFKWGGQAFGAIATGTFNASRGLRNYPAKYAMGAAKENREYRATRRAARLASSTENRRFIDRLLGGEFNLARQRGKGGQLGAREMQYARTLAEGEKAIREGAPARLLSAGYESWRHAPPVDRDGNRIKRGEAGYEKNKLDANQAWLSGEEYEGIAPDDALMGHAFDELAKFGDPDRIRMARQSGKVKEDVWAKAIARNFGRMNEIARYLTLAPDMTKLSPRQYTTQDEDSAMELQRQLLGYDYTDASGVTQHVDGGYVMNREDGSNKYLRDDERKEQRSRALAFAEEIKSNPLIYSDLGPGHRKVIDEILTHRDEWRSDDTEVTIVPGNRQEGRPDRALLPKGTTLAASTDATPEVQQQAQQAQANIFNALASEAANTSRDKPTTVADSFATQLTSPDNGEAYQSLAAKLRANAESGSAQSKQMYISVQAAYDKAIGGRLQDFEQQLIAEGVPADSIRQQIQAAEVKSRQDRARILPDISGTSSGGSRPPEPPAGGVQPTSPPGESPSPESPTEGEIDIQNS